jgi:hypothetical protein
MNEPLSVVIARLFAWVSGYRFTPEEESWLHDPAVQAQLASNQWHLLPWLIFSIIVAAILGYALYKALYKALVICGLIATNLVRYGSLRPPVAVLEPDGAEDRPE